MSARRFEGRVVLITGAGSGIGAATARRFAQEGALTIVSDVNADAAEAMRGSLAASGATAEAIALNVTLRESWASSAQCIQQTYERLDVLVNNAGITRDKSLKKMAEEDFRQVIDTHLLGTWLGCQTMLPLLAKAGHGSVVNLSSSSRHGTFGQSNYAAAKAGIVGLTRTVALEAARDGIRCNAVAPGAIRTPMTAAVPDKVRESWIETIALRRIGEPEEVAAAIAFLASDDASYITGHVLDIDGLASTP